MVMLSELSLDTLTIEELTELYRQRERLTTWIRLEMGQIALAAKRMGVMPTAFGSMVGVCYDTLRERVALAEHYEPVWDELKELLNDSPSLYHKHILLAKRGLQDYTRTEAAQHALQRLKDWAADGLSVEQAKLQLAGVDDAPRWQNEFTGKPSEIVAWFKKLAERGLESGAIYEVRVYRK